MTNTELAIQKAVEGGYGNDEWREWAKQDRNALRGYQFAELYGTDAQNHHFLSPAFWQALGKTEGWLNYDLHNDFVPWKKEQHRLIDAIQQGRSIDDFFGEILK